jgi:hypothetical protein
VAAVADLRRRAFAEGLATALLSSFPGVERDDWPLDDPKGKPIERVREIRDQVERQVRKLLVEPGWLDRA